MALPNNFHFSFLLTFLNETEEFEKSHKIQRKISERPNTHCLKMTQNVAYELWHFPSSFVLLKVSLVTHCLSR